MRKGLREPAEGMPQGVRVVDSGPNLAVRLSQLTLGYKLPRGAYGAWQADMSLCRRHIFLPYFEKSIHRDDFKIFDIYKHRDRVSEGDFF